MNSDLSAKRTILEAVGRKFYGGHVGKTALNGTPNSTAEKKYTFNDFLFFDLADVLYKFPKLTNFNCRQRVPGQTYICGMPTASMGIGQVGRAYTYIWVTPDAITYFSGIVN